MLADASASGMPGYGGLSTAYTHASNAVQRLAIHRMWAKPSTKHPAGRVYVFTDRWLLDSYDNPFPQLGTSPHVWFNDYPIPDCIYGMSGADNIRDRNVLLNALEGRIAEMVGKIVEPPFKSPLGAMIKFKPPITAGMPLEYNPVFAQGIGYLEPPRMPDAVFNWRNEIIGSMQTTLAAMPNVSPTQISGRHEALLQERLNKSNSMQDDCNAASLRWLGRHFLAIKDEMYTADRAFAVVGRGYVEFGTMTNPGGKRQIPRDVYITTGNVLPDNNVERIETVLKMLPLYIDKDTGRIDVDRVMEVLDLGTPDMDEKRLERENADRENEMMLTSGQPLPVDHFEDHKTHLRRVVAEIRRQPKGSPQREVLGMHAQAHEAELLMSLQQQLMMSQQQIAGGSAPSPTPGPNEDAAPAAAEPNSGVAIQKADAAGETSARKQTATVTP
jgi:hypothetical protein